MTEYLTLSLRAACYITFVLRGDELDIDDSDDDDDDDSGPPSQAAAAVLQALVQYVANE